ncbi:hypothetical protein BWQ96_04101 [Gracilariopsis chorda]|uniref:SCP domain-containing protein n=1 Tax=Gracilariopsis chorda TaxID=448386 RepID=A0A2V3IVI6_9FLOR|nr:hypothetical protein BWQ96_04101 [Gracilariopsis chorda]|eukprot:PXF46095.1 hypothetical protein BWQ96_04101 [Gracilariopsis chorda]
MNCHVKLLVTALLLFALRGESAPVTATSISRDVDLNVTVHQQQLLDYSKRACHFANRVRAHYGRHPLYFSGLLTRIGARHSHWMARTNIFTHQNINGLGGYVGNNWLAVSAENIAMSTPRTRDAAVDAHEQWYYSPPHFQNMISWSHTHCGVGFAWDGHGRWWGTQLFGVNHNIGHEGGAMNTAPAPAPAPAASAARAPASAPSGRLPDAPTSGPVSPQASNNRAPISGNGNQNLESELPDQEVSPGNARGMESGSLDISGGSPRQL